MKRTIILMPIFVLGLVACQSSSIHGNTITMPKVNNWWQHNVSLDNYKRAVEYIHYQAKRKKTNWAQVNELLYGLRGFSYFGDTSLLEVQEYKSLSSALLMLVGKPRPANANARFIENYSVLVYRFLRKEKQLDRWPIHLSHIESLLTELKSEQGTEYDYARWELFRAIGFVAFAARSNEQLKSDFAAQAKVVNSLVNELSYATWRREHALWALGYISQLLDEKQQTELDNLVWQKLQSLPAKSGRQAKQGYSDLYLVNSFRGKSECEHNTPERCMSHDIDKVLPIKHACSDRLWIRATSLDDEQLAYSCNRLISQESDFHSLFNTQMKSVANDNNKALQVVIFDNYSDYNRYGQLLFDINTNNGGMYIEGTPSDPNNQASFFSFQAFWTDDKFKVWNLNHEYVHYLDGRFNKYGGFGHFPDKLVWWSEGLAELVAKGNENSRAMKVLNETERAEWPSLEDIFETKYGQGSKLIYQWSYLAMRFLSEHKLDELRELQYALKSDFFSGYETKLQEISKDYEQEFAMFLSEIMTNADKPSDTSEPKIRKEYRYLYRSYLQPPHLKLTELHRHYF